MTAARKAMIDSQLRTSGVNEAFVLARMSAVPREEFVPEAQRDIAYMDRSVPLGEGGFLPSPVAHGKMLAAAAPTPQDRVLVVENGSSYLAELVRPLVEAIDTMSAAEAATKKTARKTYSLVLIDGAIEQLPGSLAKRLEEGGRIVSGVVERGVTRLATGRKVAGQIALRSIADIGMPILADFNAPKGWSF